MAEMTRILKPGGRICLTVNGIGYFLMYVRNGVRHADFNKAHYGIRGVVASLLKWTRGSDVPYAKAVNVSEMRRLMSRHGMHLDDVRLWLAQPLYPNEHYGFPTNYAFIGHKPFPKKAT